MGEGMTYLSKDNNILDLLLWRKNKKEFSSKEQRDQEQQALSQKNYFKALSFEQIMSEAQTISSDLSQQEFNIKALKEAILLLTEIEERIKKDNALISSEMESMINNLDTKIDNLKD